MFKQYRSSISYILLLFFTTASLFEIQAVVQAQVIHGKPQPINQSLDDLNFTIKRYSKEDLQTVFSKTQVKKLIHNNIYALEVRLKNQCRYPITITDMVTNLKQIQPQQLNKLLALDGFSKFLQVVGVLLSGSILFPLFLVAIPLLTLCALIPILSFIGIVCPPLSPVFGILGLAAVICSPFLVTHSMLSAQLKGLFDQMPPVAFQRTKTINPGQECTQLLFVKKEELFKPCNLMVMTAQQQCIAFSGYAN